MLLITLLVSAPFASAKYVDSGSAVFSTVLDSALYTGTSPITVTGNDISYNFVWPEASVLNATTTGVLQPVADTGVGGYPFSAAYGSTCTTTVTYRGPLVAPKLTGETYDGLPVYIRRFKGTITAQANAYCTFLLLDEVQVGLRMHILDTGGWFALNTSAETKMTLGNNNSYTYSGCSLGTSGLSFASYVGIYNRVNFLYDVWIKYALISGAP